jgi:phage head maturation protease
MGTTIYKFITEADAKDFNDTERSFTAWASRSSMDRQDEEIDASGWDLKHYRKNPVIPLFHDYGRFPIAKSLWEKISPKDKPEGLLFKPKFAETEIGNEAYYLYKEGFMSAFSVGFDPMEWEVDGETYSKALNGDFGIWQKDYVQKKRKKPRCKYLKQELLEISGVIVPAHPDALIEARGYVKTKELSEYLDSMIEQDKNAQDETPGRDSYIIKEQDKQEFKEFIRQTIIETIAEQKHLEITEADLYDIEIGDDDDIDLDVIEVEIDALGETGNISEAELIEILGDTGDDAVINLDELDI